MGSSKWTDKRFGQRIRAEREGQGWSQADMAKELSAGVDAAQTRAQQIDSLTSQALTAGCEEASR